MDSEFKFTYDNSANKIVNAVDGKILAGFNQKKWETIFFKRKFGSFFVNHAVMENLEESKIYNIIDLLLKKADQEEYHIIELHLDILGIRIAPILEDKGFRLTDTKMIFMTHMNKANIERMHSNDFKVEFATNDNFSDILRLTSQSFSDNPNFFSRFKNSKYFSKEESKRYYAAWISNSINDKDVFFAVMKTRREEKVVGYFIYKKTGFYNNKQVYKGILAAMDPDFRGKRSHLFMQHFLYDQFQEEQFYLDNTTQLTNMPTINNHIRSQKKLKRIELTFYRKCSDE